MFFDFDRAELKPESKLPLEELAKYLRSDPGMKVFIVGHTDSKGKVDYNQDLSRRRSEAVAALLTSEYRIPTGPVSPAEQVR